MLVLLSRSSPGILKQLYNDMEMLRVNFLIIYVGLIRAGMIVVTAFKLVRRDYKVLLPAAVTLVLTFVPKLLSLWHIQLNTVTQLLFPVVVVIGAFLGEGLKFYNRYAWWDRGLHVLSGILFFSFGVSLMDKAPLVGRTGVFLFSFALSLALHQLWELGEYLVDCVCHTDHQHWQKRSAVVNHQPKRALQPPGLVDTMNDSFAGLIGTTAALLGWWIFMRR